MSSSLRSVIATAIRLVIAASLAASACSLPDYSFVDRSNINAGADARSDAASASGGSSGTGARGGTDGSVGGSSGAPTGGADAAGGGPPDAWADAYVPECTSHADCGANPRRPICDLVPGVCVECWPGLLPCAEGLYCSTSYECELGCENDLSCTASGQLPGWEAGLPDASDGAVEAGMGDASADAKAFPEASAGDLDSGAADAADADAAATEASVPAFDAAPTPTGCRVSDRRCTGCQRDAECPAGALCDEGVCVNGCHPGHPCPADYECCESGERPGYGVCADLTDDPRHCNGCGIACEYAGAFGVCAAGQCSIGACRPGFADCNSDLSDGCEIDTRSNTGNCNGCTDLDAVPPQDFRCLAANNATAACRSSECAFESCNDNFENCDGDTSNGCEVNLQLNRLNCGVCGAACTLDHAAPNCEGGACVLVSCSAGYADCDREGTNGCEVNTQADPANCGGCGNACALASAESSCLAGVCTIAACVAPNEDCNTTRGDGCEVDTSSDVAHCGACFDPCNLPHAVAACAAGVCVIQACQPSYGDCDGNPANGCEVYLPTSITHCGQCNAACSSNNGTPSCALGACAISCRTDYQNCDGNLANGCEVHVKSNVDNCNACGVVCSGAGGTPNCVNGVCTVSNCAAGLANCNAQSADGCEVTTTNDVNNCGGCGKGCYVANGSPACVGGSCAVQACTPGYGDCDGVAANGCEKRLNTLFDCGACGQSCALPSAQVTCVTGTCEVNFCNSPMADCDGVDANGCEVNTLTSLDSCGTCGNACSAANGEPLCANGVCFITCADGFGNCNANVADGCETATTDDPSNCGGCSAVCAVQNGEAGCSGTTCTVGVCAAPFMDCDGFYATGCEANTSINENHCGACGNRCELANAASLCLPTGPDNSGVCEIDLCVAPFEDCDGPANGCECDPTNGCVCEP